MNLVGAFRGSAGQKFQAMDRALPFNSVFAHGNPTQASRLADSKHALGEACEQRFSTSHLQFFSSSSEIYPWSWSAWTLAELWEFSQ
jgi:hypothetical protein